MQETKAHFPSGRIWLISLGTPDQIADVLPLRQYLWGGYTLVIRKDNQ